LSQQKCDEVQLRTLRGRLQQGTTEAIKNDLVDRWNNWPWGYPVIWPSSGDVSLNFRFYQRNTMQFHDEAGTLTLTLTLTVAQEGKGDSEQENRAALAGFIHGHFGVEPGQPAFQNIANNVLSYLPWSPSSFAEMKTMMMNVSGPRTGPDGDAVHSRFI